MKIRSIGVILILAAFLFSSCGDPTAPEDLLEEDQYIAVFSQLLVINQITDEKLDGVSREYLKEQVFEEHNVTQEQFERTHRYYQQQPEQHLQRLDKIEDLLTTQRDNFQDRLNEDRKKITDSLSVSDSLLERDAYKKPVDSISINNAEIDSNIN